MELIRITDRKIKIMLTPSDMTRYELNAEDMEEDCERAHLAFRHLLKDVQLQTDLEFDDKRIAVQFFPSREGGCEMFVSSMQPICAGNEKKRDRSLTLPIPQGKPMTSGFQHDGAYRFDTVDTLLRACHRMKSIGYIGESAAYRDDHHYYYLLLRTRCPSPFALPDELAFLSEYGKVENAAMLRLYFREHGRLICSPDAVERLAALK